MYSNLERPGLPPEGPTRTSKCFDWFFALPNSAFLVAILGAGFLISPVVAAQASKIGFGAAYPYEFLAEAWKTL